MGLDMYVEKRKADECTRKTEVDFKFEDSEGESTEIFYWRKHHDLHGWFHQLYTKKKGANLDFNCANLMLSFEDLTKLEQDVQNNSLPHTEGFFFGNNPPDEETISEDLKFIKLAREAIADGYLVYYNAWY